MTDASRNDDDVAGADLQCASVGATEQHGGGASGDAEGFVGIGVEVMVRVHAGSPGGRPAVGGEGLFDCARVGGRRGAVDQQR